MSYLDDLNDQMADGRIGILMSKPGSAALESWYNHYKEAAVENANLTWSAMSKEFTDLDEYYFYTLLCDINLINPIDDDIFPTPEVLASIMEVDEGFKSYCKMQSGKGRLFGEIHFKKPIADTEMIEAALKIAGA